MIDKWHLSIRKALVSQHLSREIIITWWELNKTFSDKRTIQNAKISKSSQCILCRLPWCRNTSKNQVLSEIISCTLRFQMEIPLAPQKKKFHLIRVQGLRPEAIKVLVHFLFTQFSHHQRLTCSWWLMRVRRLQGSHQNGSAAVRYSRSHSRSSRWKATPARRVACYSGYHWRG